MSVLTTRNIDKRTVLRAINLQGEALLYRCLRASMLILLAINVMGRVPRSVDAISVRVMYATAPVGRCVTRTGPALLRSISITRSIELAASIAIHAIRSGQVCRAAGKCLRRLHRCISPRRGRRAVQVATTTRGPLAEMISQTANVVTRGEHLSSDPRNSSRGCCVVFHHSGG